MGDGLSLPPYTKRTVDRSPEICDAVPKLLNSAPTILNICTEQIVLALMMIQCVKNFPASICSADME